MKRKRQAIAKTYHAPYTKISTNKNGDSAVICASYNGDSLITCWLVIHKLTDPQELAQLIAR